MYTVLYKYRSLALVVKNYYHLAKEISNEVMNL